MRPAFRELDLGNNQKWDVEVIDTWNMTIEKAGTFSGKARVELGGKPYMAIRLTRSQSGDETDGHEKGNLQSNGTGSHP